MSIVKQWEMLRFPYDFQKGAGLEVKIFVVLGFILDVAVIAKATSKSAHFADSDLEKCVVKIPAGKLPIFTAEITYIDPNNSFGFREQQLQDLESQKVLERHGSICDYRDEFIFSIKNHPVLTPPRKQKLLSVIG